MNTKLITEIKKNAFIVILDEADTTKQEIEKLFDYAESKSYRIFFHHGIKTEKVFVLFNPTLKHVEVLPYEPVNSLLSVPRLTIQEFFTKKGRLNGLFLHSINFLKHRSAVSRYRPAAELLRQALIGKDAAPADIII